MRNRTILFSKRNIIQSKLRGVFIQVEYIVKVPKKYNSSKWNNMRVKVIQDDGTHAITENKKGKKLRFDKKWLLPINQ